MRERLFKPLGLERSFYFAHEAIVYPMPLAIPLHPGADEHEVARLYPLPRWVNAAGGIISNVNDLLTFAEFHLRDGIPPMDAPAERESAQAMRQEQTRAANFAEGYGLGWALRTTSDEHGLCRSSSMAARRMASRPSSSLSHRATSPSLFSPTAAVAPSLTSMCASGRSIMSLACARSVSRHDASLTTSWAASPEYERPEGPIILTISDGGLTRAMTLTDPLEGKTEHFPEDRLEASASASSLWFPRARRRMNV